MDPSSDTIDTDKTAFNVLEGQTEGILIALLLLDLVIRPALSETTDQQPAARTDWKVTKPSEIPTWRVWVASSAATASWVLLMQAVIHWSNLATLAMLPIVAQSLYLTLQSMTKAEESRPWPRLRLCLAFVACFVLIYEEYKLTVNGLIFSLTSMILAGVSMYLLTGEEEASDSKDPSWSVSKAFTYSTCAQTLLASYGLRWIFETEEFTTTTLQGVFPVVMKNLVATAFAVVLFESSFGRTTTRDDRSTAVRIGVSTQLLCSGSIACAAWLWETPAYASPLQLLAFLFASVFILSDHGWTMITICPLNTVSPQLYRRVGMSTDEVLLDDDENFIEHTETNSSSSSTNSSPLFWAATISLILCLWTSYTIFNINSTFPSSPSPSTRFNTTSTLDIVISHYSESPLSLHHTIQSILSLPSLSHLTPNVTIYTKSPSTNLTLLQSQTDADHVHQLPNVGRESETYLHHILTHWDTLADHTLFLQAHPHNQHQMLNRIDNYFIPSTGFLPLSDTATCLCDSCGDRNGWTETSGLIERIFSSANGRECTEGERLTLVYKGQFIASSIRLRLPGRELWTTLHEMLSDENSWAHSPGYLQGREEGMDQPIVGYTVERMWGVAMGCGEERLGRECASMMAGWRWGGGRGDCQCFD